MGNQTETAEVVVLTATVRALMVGSRQITMSVFSQLDLVDWLELAPMGRVRPKDDPGAMWAVGSNRAGELVRARLSRYPGYAADIADCERKIAESALVMKQVAEDHPRFAHYQKVAEDAAREKADLLRELADHERLVEEWKALPLIVLAGLR